MATGSKAGLYQNAQSASYLLLTLVIKCNKNSTISKNLGGGREGLKSYVPVIEDFGLGKTVIEPKTLGTTGLHCE